MVAEYESASDLGDRETLVADSRYQYIERVVAASVTKGQKPGELTLSEKVDKVVTGKYLALPCSCAPLVMFVITFGPFGSWLSNLGGGGHRHMLRRAGGDSAGGGGVPGTGEPDL